MALRRNGIVFIGSGKVAYALAQRLKKNYNIAQVYSHTLSHAKQLSEVLNCSYTDDLKKIILSADIYIIAVKDDALNEIASTLRLKDKLVVHTSGSVNIDVLKKASRNYGVLYPLQTFAAKSTLKAGTPFCLEGSSEDVLSKLAGMVKKIHGKAYRLNSEQREKLHLAAVFANNFVNYMFTVAYNITREYKVPFEVLIPLIEETVQNLKVSPPAANQTGPAARGDKGTIKRHEALLKNRPEYLKLYKALTQSIIDHAKEF